MSRAPSSTILKGIEDTPTRKAIEQILRFVRNTSTPAETSSGEGGYINVSGGSSGGGSIPVSGDYVTLNTAQHITGLKTLVCDTEASDPFLIIQDLNGGGNIPFLFDGHDSAGGVILFPAPSHEEVTKLMTNPMTAIGSIVVGGVNGFPTPLAIGNPGQFLSVGPQGNLTWSDSFTLRGSTDEGVSINREAVTGNRQLIIPDVDVDLSKMMTLDTIQFITGCKVFTASGDYGSAVFGGDITIGSPAFGIMDRDYTTLNVYGGTDGNCILVDGTMAIVGAAPTAHTHAATDVTGTAMTLDSTDIITGKKTFPDVLADAPVFQTAGGAGFKLKDSDGVELSVIHSEIASGTCRLVAGTMAPNNAKYIVQQMGELTHAQELAALGTGLLKNATTTGVLSIATGTDMPNHTHAAGQGANIPPSSVTGTAMTIADEQTITGKKSFSGGVEFIVADATADASFATITDTTASTTIYLSCVGTMAGGYDLVFPGAGGVVLTDEAVQNVRQKTFTSATVMNGVSTNKFITRKSIGPVFEDYTTASKKMRFDISGLSTTRDIAFPDASGTVALTSNLGTIASQAANNVAITGGAISGITDLAVADGGTGASTLSGAGIPQVVASYDLSAVTSGVSLTDLYADAPVGMYRISWFWYIATAGDDGDYLGLYVTTHHNSGDRSIYAVTPRSAADFVAGATSVDSYIDLGSGRRTFDSCTMTFYNEDATHHIRYAVLFPVKVGSPSVNIRARLEYLGP